MRAVILSIVFLALASTINCFPSESRTDDSTEKNGRPQIVIVPLESNPNIHRKEPSDGDSDLSTNFGDQPIVDTGIFSFNPFYGNPLSGFLSSIEAMMTRMRQQMSEVLSRLPDKSEADDSEFDDQSGVISLFPRFNIPEGKGNTTSVTKVIDGHKVVINETTYSSNNNNSGSFFKVRIVDIKPNEDDNLPTEKDAESITKDSTTTTTVPKRDTESIEESIENEIPKGNQNEEFNDIETFEESLNGAGHPANLILKDREVESLDNIDAVEQIDNNSVEESPAVLVGHGLSGDIFINKLMADAGVPPNADAESFDPESFRSSLMRNEQNVEMLKK